MTKFTIEDLRDIAYRGSYDELERELALQLLASMEQEPVLYAAEETLAYAKMGELHLKCLSQPMGEAVIPLYAAPQLPQPAVPDMAAVGEMPFLGTQEKAFVSGWNACRAAMLQAGNHTEQHLDMVNSPVIPDDVRRMDWLVSKTVDVREPMVYGSHSLFWSQTITDEEDDYHATKLREQIDAAMAVEQAAAPQQEVK